MIVELQRRPSADLEVKEASDSLLNQKLMSLLLAAYQARMQSEWHGFQTKTNRSQSKGQQGDLVGEASKLLKQGAHPNRATLPLNGFSHTPLTLAVHVGNPSLVKALLSAGASPFLPDSSGKSAVQHAVSFYGQLSSTLASKEILHRLLMSGSTECDCAALLAGLKDACDTGRTGLSEVLSTCFHWGLGIHASIANRNRNSAAMAPKQNSELPDFDTAQEVLYISLLHGGDLSFVKDYIVSLRFSHSELQRILIQVAKKSKYFRTVVHYAGTKSTQGFLYNVHKSLDKCCGRYVVDMDDYREILQDYQDFIEWLEAETKSPPNLMWHARRTILASLKGRLVPSVPHMGLPRSLEKYLLFEDLHCH